VVVSSVPAMMPSTTSCPVGESDADQVRPVVHGEVGLMVEGGKDVFVIALVVLSLIAWRDFVIAHQDAATSSSLTRLEAQALLLCAAITQGDARLAVFRCDMQAGGIPDALERLVLDEIFADRLQHRHRLVCPFDAALAHLARSMLLIWRNFA